MASTQLPGARYAGIAILLDNLPAAAFNDLAQFAHLIFDRLLVGANPNVDRGPFAHNALHCAHHASIYPKDN